MGILLVAIGKIDRKVLEHLTGNLGRIFKREISTGIQMPDPSYAFNRRRKQYLSTVILDSLLEQEEYTDYERILGVVDRDLYVPQLNFVFGQAGRRAALISLARLRQRFYGLPENRDLFYSRTLTEAVHELGHTYGLGHCNNSRCVMFFSNSLIDTDRKGPEFCLRCKPCLQAALS